jgi:Rhs element Vgr protein
MPVASPIDGISVSGIMSLTIKVDGAKIKDVYGVSSVSVTHAVNKISVADLVFQTAIDLESGALPLSDSTDFQPGKSVEILAGYMGGSETSIFKGLIVKHGVEIDETGGYSFRMTCKHKAVSMTFTQKEAGFVDMTDDAIIKKIIGEYSGITPTVTATTATHKFVFQHMSTDWDFILARAEFNGYIVTLDGDDIKIGKPELSSTAVLRVKVGESIQSFSAELIAENQPTGVEAHGWDPKTQAMISSTAAEPGVNTHGSVTAKTLSAQLSQKVLKLMSPTAIPKADLQTWADGMLLRKRLSVFKGTVKFVGSALAKPGSLIELESVGTKFNGNAFASSVTHLFDSSDGWSTTVKFGLDNTPVNEKSGFSYAPAAGQLPAIHGMQIGQVKKLSGDPDSENRIQVLLASNATNPVLVWARFANFYASNGVGLGFLPEINDEVVVGFIDNDPRYAVVLGSLYSSKQKSPNPPADENNYIKSITSKTKIKITMDDEKKSIKIETPGGNMITISDDAKSIEIVDQNSNSMKMTSSGINLESAKDITIKATGGINLTATNAVAIKSSGGDVKIDGLNIAATAQMGFTAKGNATAEISASGQTTVKGGIVMIN